MSRERENSEFFEYLTVTHMLCIFILMLDLILSSSMFSKSIYPSINIRFLVFLTFMGLGGIFLYNARRRLRRDNLKRNSLVDFAYLAFPLLAVTVALFVFRGSLFYTKVLFILPVVIASSAMGKTAGLLMSTACSVILLFYQMAVEMEPFAQALESGLFVICMMYATGWFIGGMADIEARSRERLSASLEKLRKEVARRVKVEERLRMLSSALEQSPSSVAIADTRGNIEYVNQKFTAVTGYQPGEVVGRNMFEVLGGRSPEEVEQIWGVVKSGKEWKEELPGRKKNGESYWEAVSISPFKNVAGEVTHYLRVAEDITERKRVEKEMARLEQLNLVGEMAAGIGHEIRNPMTTVRGFLQLLRDKKDCSKYNNYYELMIEELDRANSIIAEFLTMAKNKAVKKERQNLNRILAAIDPLIRADAAKYKVKIKSELGNIPELFLDENEMRQLIFNLARNGLEAMPEGGVLTISTFVDGGDVVLSVRDQGKGIAPEDVEKIGTPFFTTKEGGTGLGLSVCFSIARRHDAVINFDTCPEGTTFYVRFKQPVVQ